MGGNEYGKSGDLSIFTSLKHLIIIIANFYMRFSHEAQSAYSILLPRSLDTFQCRT